MKYAAITLIAIFIFYGANAQIETTATGYQHPSSINKNLLKLNLTSPILKNYSVQYERIINKSFSLALSGRVMPAATFPLKSILKKEFVDVDNELLNDVFSDFRFSNFAITPEARFYLGKKGYGRGFYIAPYYRFAVYKIHNNSFTYEMDDGESYILDVSGKLSSHTGGFLLGAQWFLTKKLSVDWWILGPNFGAGRGNINGITNQDLSDGAKEDVRKYLEDIDIPFSKKQVYVDDKTARVVLSGPWAGVRAGILLGLRF